MTQDGSEQEKIEQEKAYGDSATAVTPDTQQPPQGEPVDESAEEDDDAPDPAGTDADTVSDGPDKDSGFYG
ncbi:MAG TPA: hypothetical protein VD859_11495 [Nocardioides sp.]|nr:hypothetical protein [Nocardioides sp.]